MAERIYWRRAEGMTFAVGAGEVVVRRSDQATPTQLAWDLAALLLQLSRWTTARDLASRSGLVTRDVERFLRLAARRGWVWWSRGDGLDRVLQLAPLTAEGVLRLRDGIVTTPLGRHDGVASRWPAMPRKVDRQRVALDALHLSEVRRATETTSVMVHLDAPARAAVARVWPLLSGVGLDVATLAADAPARALVELLARSGVLAPGRRRARPPARGASVTWLGHACALVDTAAGGVLVDPLFGPAATAALDRRSLPPLAAVLITHGDSDHLNPSALLRIDRDVPVVIPALARARRWQVDIAHVLATLGFRRVVQLAHWQHLRLGKGAEVLAFPFEGENWDLELCASTYGVRTGDGSGAPGVYFSADAAGMEPHAARIRRSLHVTVAFLGVADCVEAKVMTDGFGYGRFYDRWIKGLERARFSRLVNGPAEALRLGEAIGARHVFGYAAGTPPGAMGYSDEGSDEQLKALAAREGSRCAHLTLRVGRSQRIDRLSGAAHALSADAAEADLGVE